MKSRAISREIFVDDSRLWLVVVAWGGLGTTSGEIGREKREKYCLGCYVIDTCNFSKVLLRLFEEKKPRYLICSSTEISSLRFQSKFKNHSRRIRSRKSLYFETSSKIHLQNKKKKKGETIRNTMTKRIHVQGNSHESWTISYIPAIISN